MSKDTKSYYFFGEFGFFNIFLLRYLSYYLEHNPTFKFNINTYEDYGIILKLLFSNNIDGMKLLALDNNRDRESNLLDRKYELVGENLLKYLVDEYNKINKTFIDWSKLWIVRGHAIDIMVPKYNLKIANIKTKKIGIFPRFRRNHWTHNAKFFNESFWLDIIKYFKSLNKEIILFGHPNEIITINDSTLMRPTNIIDTIQLLNTIDLLITPCSGFASFAQNCNTAFILIMTNTDLNDEACYTYYKYFDSKIKYMTNVNNNSKMVIEEIQKR